MKQESNNAIDLMLRKLGRSGSRVHQNAGNGSAESETAHLDADELNAYVENALPTTTRARYTEHLADCLRCRQIVSQLSQAAAPVIDASPKAAPGSGLKAFLASLFSPIVLRYAVPALGLLIVASIGFIALRQSGRMELAQAPNGERVAVTPTPGDTGTSASATSSSNSPQSQRHTTNTRQEVDKSEQAKLYDEARVQEKEEEARGKPATSADQVTAATPPSNTRFGTPDDAKAAPKPTIVEEQKQAAPQVAQDKVQAPSAQTGSVQSARATDEPAARRAAKEPSPTISSLTSVSGLKKGETESPAANERAGTEESGGKRARDRADKDKAEMTSVAGHRFRKSGSVWTDVTYTSSQSTTNVARGSDQYRALIADEPGIRTIAEQLQGEVIVVWKGRAYRIR
jgi:hypothetical protein